MNSARVRITGLSKRDAYYLQGKQHIIGMIGHLDNTVQTSTVTKGYKAGNFYPKVFPTSYWKPVKRIYFCAFKFEYVDEE